MTIQDIAKRLDQNAATLEDIIHKPAGTYVNLPNGGSVPSVQTWKAEAINTALNANNYPTRAEFDGLVDNRLLTGGMSKTFYVDAVNGNDLNNGSSTSPFKTLKKACDSVPAGGYGLIYIIGDYTLQSSVDRIVLEGKRIILYHSTTTPNAVLNIIMDYGAPVIIARYASTLTLGLDITITSQLTTTYYAINASYNSMLILAANNAKSVVNGTTTYSTFNVPSNYYMFYLYNSSGYFSGIDVNLADTTSLFFFQQASNFYMGNINLTVGGTATTSFPTYIGNIIKDANGVPRNATTNIIL